MPKPPQSILIFEDDEGQALLTKEALEKEGFVVDVAMTGRAGLERVAAHVYDVALIDMRLPDTTGIEVLRRINAIRPSLVPIVVTGHGDELAAVEAMKLGAYDYVVKSPTMGHLAALPLIIREGLERRLLKSDKEQLQTEVWEQARLLEERNAELRRANEELKRLDQMKSDLVSTVSHELRTPLATIKEFASIVGDGIAGPVTANQKEYLGIITSNIERLARIIDDLLDMAKIEAGRVLLNRGVVEVMPLVDSVVQSMRPLAEAKGATLTIEVPEAVPAAFADPDRVTQVLTNLLSNAVKFTPKGGRITIRLQEQTNEIQFDVEDTGTGIAPEDQPKLFQKFQQFRRASPGDANAKGTGLGLAISKRLVDLHGGRIWVSSVKDQGSTFSFTLPKYHMEEVFRDYIRTGLERARREQHHFSLIVVSLMNFPELKALYGLETMGTLLKEYETVLRETIRKDSGDVVIRWQRGEMVMILANVDRPGAQAIGDRIQRTLGNRGVAINGATVQVPVLVAIATYPQDGRTDEELLQATDRQLRRGDQAKTTILVVDDEPKIRKFLKEALEMRDYDVMTAASGTDALEQVKSRKVHLVLLDVMMPVMTGYEVYHLLKEDQRTRDIPVIMVTAKGERKDRELGLSTPSYNYMVKPFQLEDLLLKVREVLQQHSGSRAA